MKATCNYPECKQTALNFNHLCSPPLVQFVAGVLIRPGYIALLQSSAPSSAAAQLLK